MPELNFLSHQLASRLGDSPITLAAIAALPDPQPTADVPQARARDLWPVEVSPDSLHGKAPRDLLRRPSS